MLSCRYLWITYTLHIAYTTFFFLLFLFFLSLFTGSLRKLGIVIIIAPMLWCNRECSFFLDRELNRRSAMGCKTQKRSRFSPDLFCPSDRNRTLKVTKQRPSTLSSSSAMSKLTVQRPGNLKHSKQKITLFLHLFIEIDGTVQWNIQATIFGHCLRYITFPFPFYFPDISWSSSQLSDAVTARWQLLG